MVRRILSLLYEIFYICVKVDPKVYKLRLISRENGGESESVLLRSARELIHI